MKIPINEKNYSFRLIPQDLEHFLPEERESYFEEILQSFLKMKEECFLKIYFKDEKVYANSDDKKFNFPWAKVKKEESLIEKLLGKEFKSSDILNRGDHLKVGGKYLRFFKMKKFPEEIADEGHFNQVAPYFICFKKLNQTKAINLLDRKRRLFRSNNTAEFSDYSSIEGESQAENLLSQIQLGTEGLVEVEFWFWIEARTEEILAEETKNLLYFFENHKGEIKLESLGLSEAFLNFMPGTTPSFLDSSYLPLNYLLGLLPLSSDFLHKQGTLFYSQSGRGVYFDPFAGENFNIAIIGRSGSGKTFLAQKIVDDYLKRDMGAMIVDRGDSFLSLAQYHEGTILSGKLNPLQFKNNPSFLTEFLASFIPKEEFSHLQKCQLFKIIKEARKEKMEDFQGLLNLIEKDMKGFSLYFEEHKSLLMDDPQKISKLTYVDTRKYPNSFLRPLFLYLIEYVKNIKGRKCFVFEECWHSLHHNIDYLSEFFRTSRAQGISCVAISQLLEDLTESEVGKAIAENTFFKFFFSSPKQESSYLDEDDLGRIKSSQMRQFYLKTPYQRKLLQYHPTGLEHELFTSHYEDKKKRDAFIEDFKDYLDYKTLIHRWSELKYGKEDSYQSFVL